MQAGEAGDLRRHVPGRYTLVFDRSRLMSEYARLRSTKPCPFLAMDTIPTARCSHGKLPFLMDGTRLWSHQRQEVRRLPWHPAKPGCRELLIQKGPDTAFQVVPKASNTTSAPVPLRRLAEVGVAVWHL